MKKQCLLLLLALVLATTSQAQQLVSISDYDIITEQPEGELHIYQRSGQTRRLDGDTNKLTTQEQTGILSVVFANDGTVYLQNPISGITGYLSRGCWVKGTLNSSGDTITVPLGQGIDYINSFDILCEMFLYRYNKLQDTFLPDKTATEITYTIDAEGCIKLNGTAVDCILSGTYRSPSGHEVGSQVDGLWVEMGDYASVYTPLDEQPVSLPANVAAEPFRFMASANYGMGWEDYSAQSLLAVDGDDVFLQGFCRYLPKAWIKGRRENNTLTFPSGQFLGNYSNEPIYFVGGRDTADDIAITDVVFTFNGKDTYTTPDYFIINGKKDELYVYHYYYGATVTQRDYQPVEAPADLVASAYTLNYDTYDADGQLTSASSFVNIGFKDGEVYMQHIWDFMPNAWVKGRLEEGKVVFDAPQLLGYYEENNERLPAFFVPFDMRNGDLLDTITFSYDPEAGTLEASGQAIGICLNTARLLTYVEIRNPSMTAIPDVAVVPATPSILEYVGAESALPYISVRVPGEGAQGETIDLNKLSYQLLSDVEGIVTPIRLTTERYERLPYDMEAIPWLYEDNYDVLNFGDGVFRVFLNDSVADYNRIGVQSIYSGGGESLTSPVVWRNIKDYSTGIEQMTRHSSRPAGQKEAVYDLKGHKVFAPRKGLYIKEGRKQVR